MTRADLIQPLTQVKMTGSSPWLEQFRPEPWPEEVWSYPFESNICILILKNTYFVYWLTADLGCREVEEARTLFTMFWLWVLEEHGSGIELAIVRNYRDRSERWPIFFKTVRAFVGIWLRLKYLTRAVSALITATTVYTYSVAHETRQDARIVPILEQH